MSLWQVLFVHRMSETLASRLVASPFSEMSTSPETDFCKVNMVLSFGQAHFVPPVRHGRQRSKSSVSSQQSFHVFAQLVNPASLADDEVDGKKALTSEFSMSNRPAAATTILAQRPLQSRAFTP